MIIASGKLEKYLIYQGTWICRFNSFFFFLENRKYQPSCRTKLLPLREPESLQELSQFTLKVKLNRSSVLSFPFADTSTLIVWEGTSVSQIEKKTQTYHSSVSVAKAVFYYDRWQDFHWGRICFARCWLPFKRSHACNTSCQKAARALWRHSPHQWEAFSHQTCLQQSGFCKFQSWIFYLRSTGRPQNKPAIDSS